MCSLEEEKVIPTRLGSCCGVGVGGLERTVVFWYKLFYEIDFFNHM